MSLSKFKHLIQKVNRIFNLVSDSAELKLDAFILTKQQTQIRALVAGTGVFITIPLSSLTEQNNLLARFSSNDVDVIYSVLQDTSSLSHYLIEGKKIEIVAQTFDRKEKKSYLRASIVDYSKNAIEFEIDPLDLSRNKFLLQLFNKKDAFIIGYAAAENRLRTETAEIKNANILR